MESVYLANCVLYFTNFTTLIEFIFVSKNCRDAVEMLYRNPCTTVDTPQTPPLKYLIDQQIFVREIQVFPHLETIEIMKGNVPLLQFLFMSKPPFKFNRRASLIINDEMTPKVFSFFSNNIVELKNVFLTESVDCSKFSRLQKASFVVSSNIKMDTVFPDKMQRLKYLKVTSRTKVDEQFLNELKSYNINQIVVVLESKKQIKKCAVMYKNVNKVIVCSNSYWPEIPANVIVISSSYFEVTGGALPQKVISQYLPSKIRFSSSKVINQMHIDLSQEECITEIWSGLDNLEITFPRQLEMYLGKYTEQIVRSDLALKRLFLENPPPFHVPDSVEYLQLLSRDFCIQNFETMKVKMLLLVVPTFQFAKGNTNILSMSLVNTQITQSFKGFENLKKLKLYGCTIHYNIDQFYPDSLASLECFPVNLPSHSNVFKLKVTNSYTDKFDLRKFQKLIEVDLTAFNNKLKFPKSLESLVLTHIKGDKIDISGHTQLSSVFFDECSVETCLLPKGISTVVLNKSQVVLKKMKKVCTKNLIVVESSINLFDINNETLQLLMYDNDMVVTDIVFSNFKALIFPPFKKA
ncbi:hypothetical protein EIN_222370 [Entamoeba invadens IP1]|uniref:Uncharacterized protein n=1 Tax=Entamoeba invadens IP1 TaxID=370355 RepID=A0A0A1U246_ENTIV|nr:hypothetical protein EIN_222370 [Entamoeba invadens IP1]ELP88094.1 hypothetical protein EIN_222370 [Entamoeba invadens IP1]|eukprot:XP_004254865.1 hypothetical protein EIN_222370 [Entamoeba invadens IP1]